VLTSIHFANLFGPKSHWKTTTFVATLRRTGLTVPMVIDGALTGDLFVPYVEQVRVPTPRPGDVVVWDNLACHRRAGASAAVEQSGGLPPYRPDFKPIELAFSKLKRLL